MSNQPPKAPIGQLVMDGEVESAGLLGRVRQWSDADARAAEEWAASVHLQASDNDVRVPPTPSCVADLRT